MAGFYVDTYSTKYTCPFSSVSCSHPYGKSETQERPRGQHMAEVEWAEARWEGEVSCPSGPAPNPVPPEQQPLFQHT